ncbi:MAG: hypothetical protein OEY01_13150 [Desulfobulbaceae bacterium]|nr:hypothetical protein [Desulfobulbaceae bacterium]HIJ79676.1 hypothetical protein [Deltaproteobacteria bacterium]
MKMMKKRFEVLFLAWVLLAGAVAVPGSVWAGSAEDDEMGAVAVQHEMSLQSYASLPGLVAMICSDAMLQYEDFFNLSPIMIEPFVVLNEFSVPKKISLLGATLADQMAAVISNETLAAWRGSDDTGGYEQRVSGLLQEMDGYLRVHITGVNTMGERRSYVVNVEMSEPIYRALHSYVYTP